MQNNYLKMVLKIKEYDIEKIEEKDDKLYVYCHVRKKGIWYNGEYSKVQSTTRLKESKHMIIEDILVILKITQRKFYFKKQNKRIWEELPGFLKEKTKL